jgi:phospho-N-acetylmuramoyl-pentapeptide-transferase
MPLTSFSTLVAPLYPMAVFLMSLGIVLLFAPAYIRLLRKLSFGQYIREDGPQQHQAKAGTPTAGGVLILSACVASLLFGRMFLPASLFTPELMVVLGVMLTLGALGAVDDFLKIFKKHNKGVNGYTKLAVQILAGIGVGVFIMQTTGTSGITLFNLGRVELGLWYPVFAAFAITATSNAVNLTDGLDGLASSTMIISLLSLACIFGLMGWGDRAIVYPDLLMFCFALMGSVLGFLVFNAKPARIFMGDVGSLALGGALGALALLGQVDCWLAFIGGIFALEALSVILQVISFKATGKRIFKMSPLHHHFELCGWSENQVVLSFAMLQLGFCSLAVFLYNS